MKLFSKEHDKLIVEFENSMFRLESRKESKELWLQGRIYKSSWANDMFKAFRLGYEFGKKRGDA